MTWFALVAALGELAALAVRHLRAEEPLVVSGDLVWMAPVAYLTFFLLVWLVLWLTAGVVKTVGARSTLTLVLTVLTFLSWLLLYPLHWAAALTLATGLALQTTRILASHRARFQWLIQKSVAWLGFLTAALGVGSVAWRSAQERRAVAARPAAPAGAPNVLLLILDTVRALDLSLYGYARRTTPNWERFAARGAVFERALTPAPWTLPAHASIFTGRWPHELSANWRKPLDDTYPTLAERLRAHGYATGGFVANLIYTSRQYGLGRGFTHYEDFLVSPGQLALSFSLGRAISNAGTVRRIMGYHDILNRKSAARLHRDFLRWATGVKGRPFFAFINYFDAHEPLFPPDSFAFLFGVQRPKGPFVYRTSKVQPADRYAMSAADVQVERDAYDGALAYLDQQLGTLFRELERLGLLDNTVVIVTSDHGDQFNEHRLLAHGNSLYMSVLHVPLVVVCPGRVAAGSRVHRWVSLRDLPATIIDLAGLGADTSLPGRSLATLWAARGDRAIRPDTILSEVSGSGMGTHPERPWEPVTHGNLQSLVLGPYHYIRTGSSGEELYNVDQDLAELRDLARGPEEPALPRLRELLDAWGRVSEEWRARLSASGHPGGRP